MIDKLFTFWKKKDKPKITWWSTIQGLDKVVPIVPAKEYMPDWWKRVERMIDSNNMYNKGTIKNCPSMPEFLSQGFVVPLWCDLRLIIEHDKWRWESPHQQFSFTKHEDSQFRDWIPKHTKDNSSIILKPNCPWRIKTPPGWSVWQLPMFYDFNPIFEVLPGIIWTDIHHEINQQMLIKKYGDFLIKRGTPLAMYVPYERKKYEYEIQGPTEENMSWTEESFSHVLTKFKGGYKLNQARAKKCPFNK